MLCYLYKQTTILVYTMRVHLAITNEGASSTNSIQMDDLADGSTEPLLPTKKPSGAKRCRCGCCVTSRGALVVVAWSALLHGFYYYLGLQILVFSDDYKVVRIIYGASALVQALSLLFYPVAGLMAETCCSRLKIMIAGTILMAAGIVVYSPFLVILNMIFDNEKDPGLQSGFVILLFFSLMPYQFGLAAFEANAIQFGTDQLQSAPSEELSKFVHWYFWSTVLLNYFFNFGGILIDPSNVQLEIVPYIQFVLLLLALVLVAICCYKKVLTIEPVSHKNPVKLIFAVMNFARAHKRALFRSAFTYGEAMPTRLDLAKVRYGGPFATEQVEDVKSFWRISLLLLPLFGYLLTYQQFAPNLLYATLPSMIDLLNHTELNSYFIANYLLGPPQLGTVVPVVAIPVYELVVRPCTSKWRLSMLKRMSLGMVVSLGTLVSISVMKYLVEHEAPEEGVNCTEFISNLYSITEPSQIPLVLYLAPIPVFLTGVSYLLVFMTVLEFILAQAPRSMQGLLIGLWYAYQSLGVVAGAASGLILDLDGCHYWLDLVNVGLGVISCVLFILAASCYRYRLREEPADINQRSIVEEYTERQLYRRLNYVPPVSYENSIQSVK